jgi:hypothetical protein
MPGQLSQQRGPGTDQSADPMRANMRTGFAEADDRIAIRV